MTRALSNDQARWLRLRSQRLAGPGPASVPELVRALGAVQAQHPPATRLALRPRTSGLDLAAVASAWNERRSVVRTWLLRGTLHAVAAEDLGWLLALLGPRFAAAGRRRRRELGLDDELCERGLRAIRRVLAATGALDRAEPVRRLAGHGVVLAGQARAPLVAPAAPRGVVRRRPARAPGAPAYVLAARAPHRRPARRGPGRAAGRAGPAPRRRARTGRRPRPRRVVGAAGRAGPPRPGADPGRAGGGAGGWRAGVGPRVHDHGRPAAGRSRRGAPGPAAAAVRRVAARLPRPRPHPPARPRAPRAGRWRLGARAGGRRRSEERRVGKEGR